MGLEIMRWLDTRISLILGFVVEDTTASISYIGTAEGVNLGDVTIRNAFGRECTLWETLLRDVATFENVEFGSERGEVCAEGGVGPEGLGRERDCYYNCVWDGGRGGAKGRAVLSTDTLALAAYLDASPSRR